MEKNNNITKCIDFIDFTDFIQLTSSFLFSTCSFGCKSKKTMIYKLVSMDIDCPYSPTLKRNQTDF